MLVRPEEASLSQISWTLGRGCLARPRVHNLMFASLIRLMLAWREQVRPLNGLNEAYRGLQHNAGHFAIDRPLQ